MILRRKRVYTFTATISNITRNYAVVFALLIRGILLIAASNRRRRISEGKQYSTVSVHTLIGHGVPI